MGEGGNRLCSEPITWLVEDNNILRSDQTRYITIHQSCFCLADVTLYHRPPPPPLRRLHCFSPAPAAPGPRARRSSLLAECLQKAPARVRSLCVPVQQCNVLFSSLPGAAPRYAVCGSLAHTVGAARKSGPSDHEGIFTTLLRGPGQQEERLGCKRSTLISAA